MERVRDRAVAEDLESDDELERLSDAGMAKLLKTLSCKLFCLQFAFF